MTAPSAIPVYTQGFGTSSTAPAIIEQVNPGNYLPVGIKLGQHWINEAANTVYVLTSVSTSAGVTTPTWTLLESGASSFLSLTGDTGTATPSAGNVKIAGTANEITTAASGSTVTLSIPSSPSLPGTVTAATGFIATNGNLALNTAGNKLVIATGSNASVGTSAAMSGGTITVSTTAVTASSKIFVSANTPGGTAGTLSAPTASITPATSFVINSSSGLDTSTVNWWIVN